MITNARLLCWLPSWLPDQWQRIDRLEPHVATYLRAYDGLTAWLHIENGDLRLDFSRELESHETTAVIPLFTPKEALGDTLFPCNAGSPHTSVAIHLQAQ
jgi:hypothetical protein